MSWHLLLRIIGAVILLFFYLNQVESACQPLPDFKFSTPLTYPSVCRSVLPYQMVYIDDDVYGSCPLNPIQSYENEIQRIVSIVSTGKLSKRCGDVLMMKHCAMVYKPCNSTHTGPIPDARPCQYLCDAISDPSVCNADDLAAMRNFGVNMSRLDDCDNQSIWSNDIATCYGPSQIPSIPSTPRCESYTGTFCSGIPGYHNQPIYVPAGMTQNDLEYLIQDEAYLYNAIPNDGANKACASALTAYLCSIYLPTCSTSATVPYAYPLPQYPCRDICTRVSTQCSLLFYFYVTERPELAPLCTARTLRQDTCHPNPEPGQSNFPLGDGRDFTRYSLPTPADSVNITAVMECSAMAANVVSIPYPTECPAPLVLPDDPTASRINDGRCALPCPTMLWSSKDYRRFDVIGMVFGIISLVLGVFLILTFLIFKNQRHKRYILLFTINATLLSFMLFLGILVKGSAAYTAESHCQDNTQTDILTGFCGAQAVFIVFFLQATVTFWLVQTMELFLRVVLQRNHPSGSKASKQTEVVYQIFAWGVPFMSTLSLITGDFLGSSNGHPFCYITYERYTQTTGQNDGTLGDFYNVPLYTYFIPMCIMGAVGTILIAWVLYVLFKHRRDSNNHDSATTTTGYPHKPHGNSITLDSTDNKVTAITNHKPSVQKPRHNDKHQKQQHSHHPGNATGIRTSVFIRLISYDIVMLILIAFIVFYDFYLDTNRDTWHRSLITYATCLLRDPSILHNDNVLDNSDLDMFPSDGTSTCTLRDTFPLGLMIVFVIILYSLGIVTFLIHGTSVMIYRAWFGLFHRLTGLEFFKKWSIDMSDVNFDSSTDQHSGALESFTGFSNSGTTTTMPISIDTTDHTTTTPMTTPRTAHSITGASNAYQLGSTTNRSRLSKFQDGIQPSITSGSVYEDMRHDDNEFNNDHDHYRMTLSGINQERAYHLQQSHHLENRLSLQQQQQQLHNPTTVGSNDHRGDNNSPSSKSIVTAIPLTAPLPTKTLGPSKIQQLQDTKQEPSQATSLSPILSNQAMTQASNMAYLDKHYGQGQNAQRGISSTSILGVYAPQSSSSSSSSSSASASPSVESTMSSSSSIAATYLDTMSGDYSINSHYDHDHASHITGQPSPMSTSSNLSTQPLFNQSMPMSSPSASNPSASSNPLRVEFGVGATLTAEPTPAATTPSSGQSNNDPHGYSFTEDN